MAYQFDWDVVLDPSLWAHAILTTLTYAIGSIVAGSVLGCLFGLLLLSYSRWLKIIIGLYVQLFRCTPLVVQIVWIFYALPMITGLTLPYWLSGGVGLTLYMAAFSTEIFRAGILNVDNGQWNASRALGMSYGQLIRHIILPQAFKRMVPPFVSQCILQLKNTSLLYVVAIPELMYAAQEVTNKSYRPLEAYTAVALIYLVMLWPFTILAKKIELKGFQK